MKKLNFKFILLMLLVVWMTACEKHNRHFDLVPKTGEVWDYLGEEVTFISSGKNLDIVTLRTTEGYIFRFDQESLVVTKYNSEYKEIYRPLKYKKGKIYLDYTEKQLILERK